MDASLETVADWKKPYEKGVVYYLKEQRLRGVLLWNVWDRVQQARDLIAKGDVLHPDNLRSMIGDWRSLEEALEESFPASDPPATW